MLRFRGHTCRKRIHLNWRAHYSSRPVLTTSPATVTVSIGAPNALHAMFCEKVQSNQRFWR